MFYSYAVEGKRYSGMSFLGLSDLDDKGGRPNRTIRVYYKKSDPSVSYAVYHPSLRRWLRLSAFVGLTGILVAVLSRPRLHLTPMAETALR
ncbi:MAG TPA: hypothetical protein VGL24_02725 [Chthoniobacterales bacterium]